MPILETEAKTLWCPFARVTSMGDSLTITNRGETIALYPSLQDPSANVLTCIGSQCMAWSQYNGRSGFCKLVDK